MATLHIGIAGVRPERKPRPSAENGRRVMPKRPRLQAAIDTLTVEEAVALSAALRGIVDLIEAGTPFIKRYGIGVVPQLHDASGLPIVADLKIADGGPFEAQLAVDAGAALVTVLGTAADAT